LKDGWDEAIEFLKQWRVIVVENDAVRDGAHVYLHRYWIAEKRIAEAFQDLRKRHETEPLKFDIDWEKYLFHVININVVHKVPVTDVADYLLIPLLSAASTKFPFNCLNHGLNII